MNASQIETLPVLIEVGVRVGEGLDQVLGKAISDLLRHRVAGSEDDVSAARQLLDERVAAAGGIDEHQAPGDWPNQIGPFSHAEVGSYQIEFRVFGTGGCPVPDQQDQQHIVFPDALPEGRERSADVLARRLADTRLLLFGEDDDVRCPGSRTSPGEWR